MTSCVYCSRPFLREGSGSGARKMCSDLCARADKSWKQRKRREANRVSRAARVLADMDGVDSEDIPF